jgi:hypothetical protein
VLLAVLTTPTLDNGTILYPAVCALPLHPIKQGIASQTSSTHAGGAHGEGGEKLLHVTTSSCTYCCYQHGSACLTTSSYQPAAPASCQPRPNRFT